MIIISIIVILLLAGKVFSLHVQGSVSIINDDTILINLHVNKLSVGDDFNELVKKLQAAKVKPRILLMIDLGEKVIEINGGTDHEQDYFQVNFDKVTASRNVAETNMANNPINTKESILNEIFCKTMCNSDFARSMTSRSRNVNKLVGDISDILRRVTLLMHEHSNKKLINQESIYHQKLRHYFVSQGYQDSMNFDQGFEYFVPPQTFNTELSLEKEKLGLKSELEMFLEYTKSVQDSLLLLTKLLDVKLQLHSNFDDTLRWKLLSLRKQAEFLLENLIEEVQRQYEKTKSKKYDFPRDGSENVILNSKKINKKEEKTKNDKKVIKNQPASRTKSLIPIHQDSSKDTSRNDILNTEEIKVEKTTILNEKDKENLNEIPKTTSLNEKFKANFDRTYNKTQKTNRNVIDDQNALKAEMRFLSFPTLLKNISRHYFKNNSSKIIKINPINQELTIKSTKIEDNSIINNNSFSKTKTSQNKNSTAIKAGFVNKRTFSKPKKFARTSHDKLLTPGLEDHGNWSNQLRNVSLILPNENMLSTLKKVNQQEQIIKSGTQNTLRKFLKENVTDIPKRFVLWDKNEDQKKENQNIARKNIISNRLYSNVRVNRKIDRTSMMDEILETVNKVLPTKKSEKMLSQA